MSEITSKLKLIKPTLNDNADITQYNDNWDILDNAVLTTGGEVESKLTFKDGLAVDNTIAPTIALEKNIGTEDVPFGSMYAKHYNIFSHPNKECGELSVHKTGTATIRGEAVISAGNDTAEGTVGNSRGRVRLFGMDTGYTDIISGNGDATNYEILLPNGNGTLQLNESAMKIAKGSYVGTGTYGEANANQLSFDFEPKILILGHQGANDCATTLVRGVLTTVHYSENSRFGIIHHTWEGNTVSWYSVNNQSNFTGAQIQYNSGIIHYVAIG